MAVIAPPAKQQFFDSNGDPLAGGLLYTYAPGTTTDKATYQDRLLAAANTNPIVLDSRGEAVIYLTGATKFVLKTAAGATIWTRDSVEAWSISGPVDVTSYGATGGGTVDDRSALNAANAAGVDLYFPAGTYLVESNLTLSSDCYFADGAKLYAVNGATITISNGIFANNLSQIFDWDSTSGYVLAQGNSTSVRWFGAKGDNSNNDSVAFQKCIDSANGVAGITVFIPAGTYLLNDTVSITNNRVTLRGESIPKSIINKGITTGNCFSFYSGDPTTVIRDFSVENLSFNHSTASTAGADLRFLACKNIFIEDIYVTNPFRAIWITSCQEVSMNDIKSITNITYSYLVNSSHYVFDENTSCAKRENVIKLTNVSAANPSGYYNTDYGFWITSADGIWFDGCYSGEVKKAGINIDPVNSDAQITGVRIDNTWFDPGDSGAKGLWIHGDTTGAFGLIQVSDCIFSGGTTADNAIHVDITDGTTLEYLSINGNQFLWYDSNGILISSTTAGTAPAVKFLTITGNIMSFVGITSGNGITVSSTENFTISDNVIGYKFRTSGAAGSDYGISIGGTVGGTLVGCDNYTVTGNMLLGNATGGINDGTATSVNKIIKNNLTEQTDSSVADIASATTITIPAEGEFFNITGTTAITGITASWAGRRITLKFADALTFTDGSNLKIATNFSTSADDTITMFCDGTNWYEVARSAN